jgi:hypothetical protein
VATLTDIGQYIIGSVESCAGKYELSDACAKTSLALAGSISAAAGSSTSLSQGCSATRWMHTEAAAGASCVVDIRASMQDLLTVILSLTKVSQQCDTSPEQCASSTAHAVATLADLAKFVVSAAGDCVGQLPPGAACGEDIASIVQSLTTIATAGTVVEQSCNPSAKTPPPEAQVLVQPGGQVTWPHGIFTKDQTNIIAAMRANISNFKRLYQKTAEESSSLGESKQKSLPVTVVLCGLMALVAVVGFQAGRRSGVGEERQTTIVGDQLLQ